MKVFIVYCHPSKNSFTYEVKESFINFLSSKVKKMRLRLWAAGYTMYIQKEALLCRLRLKHGGIVKV